MKKKIIIVSVSIICLAIGSFIYLQMDDSKQVSETYLQTLIYQDANHDLVPVSLNVHNQMELETDIRKLSEEKNDLIRLNNLFYENAAGTMNSKLEDILGFKFDMIVFEDGRLEASIGDYHVSLYQDCDSLRFHIFYFEDKKTIDIYEVQNNKIIIEEPKLVDKELPNKAKLLFENKDNIFQIFKEFNIYQYKYII